MTAALICSREAICPCFLQVLHGGALGLGFSQFTCFYVKNISVFSSVNKHV